MKVFKRLLILVSLLLVLMMTGCSGEQSRIQVDTSLNADTSFAGEREMDAVIPAALYKKAFDRDIDKLNTLIGQNVPEGVTCTASENDDKTATIHMQIDFTTWKEYQTAIENICSVNDTDTAVKPVINFSYSRSILKNGYTIEENFTSCDLFYWLAEAFIGSSDVFEDYTADQIFELGSTQVIFDGQTTDMSETGYISISDLTSNAFDSIQVAVTFNDDDTYDTEIDYVVSNDVVASLGEKLEKLMESIVPSEGYLSYEDTAYNRTYILSIPERTDSTLKTALNKALCTNDTEFEVTTEGESDSLAGTETVTEYFNGSYFLDFTEENTSMSYVLIVPSSYTVNSCEGAYGYLQDNTSVYNNSSCKVVMDVSNSEEVTTVLGFAVDIDSVDISTSVYNDSRAVRKVSIKLSESADELIGSSLQERFDKMKETWPDGDAVTIDTEPMISTVTYSITMKAETLEEMTEMTQTLFNENAEDNTDVVHSSISGGLEAKTDPWNISYKIDDALNLSGFLKGSQVSSGISYSLSFPKGFKASFAGEIPYENAETDRETVTCTTYDKIMTVSCQAEKINLIGILILIIWIISLVFVMLWLLFNGGHIIYWFQKKQLDVDAGEFLTGRKKAELTLGCVAFVALVFMSIRLIFKIY